MTFAASWCFCAIGIDPAADLRGTYRTREAAHALLERAGGHAAFMAAHLDPVGARRVQHPQDGDIGLCRMLAGDDETTAAIALVGVVRFGPAWAAIAPHGVVVRRSEHIACWRLPV
ncbi:hypothetical protein NAC44_11910 [Allorhizobium sp. BGMRC 0089]|uniref:DUF6950 family protein n=1 Tax=Allorhizobium sonneratiae TaxID=2934936 RepID=UPI002033CD12|nr:hypothetical protein [Allorhizobium sonneratiae]MCM2293027.1 hypothetical protein [Allorhizobium sonneratiae]